MRLVLAAAAALLAASPALAVEPLRVGLDQTARIRLAGVARDVLVANPGVADVTMLDGRNLVVLGKKYGVTSVLVIDGVGRTIMDRSVIVSAPEGAVSVYRGAVAQTYACSPTCEVADQGGESADAAKQP